MNTPIKTNKMQVRLNRQELTNRYDIFIISTTENFFSHGAYILDAPLLCNNICSVYFTSGKEFYVLLRKNDANKTALKKVLSEAEGGDTITISSILPTQITDNILVQLLLNSLSNYQLDFMKFNNLTGHFYCFHPKWIKKGKNGDQYTILKVPCLELKISDEMILIMQVHTFTSELLRNKMTFRKKKFEQYPKYVFSANNTLRRKLKDDNGKCFIMRQTDGAKTEIPFLDIQNKEKYATCKMGVLTEILEFFNSKMNDICYVGFSFINDYKSLNRTRSVAKENEQNIKHILESNTIKIVDKIGDEYSFLFCKKIQNLLKEKYSIAATVGKRIVKEALNICLIHNAAYYEDMEDPHNDIKEGYTIQHLTFEDFMGNAEFALSTVIHELLIKSDVENGKISLFDWSKLGMQENVSFGLKEADEIGNRYFFICVTPNGDITFSEQTLNLFEFNEYSECVNVFEDNPLACGIIKRANGDMNIICDTNWITIPEIEQLKAELFLGNTHLRNKTKREELLTSILDIKLFEEENAKHYFVGTIGEGMRTKVGSAANIRKIISHKDAPLMFDDILPLMNVTFVRNGQLTVVPFPFKYLREYIKQKV